MRTFPTLEAKYGVEQGDDWMAVANNAQFQRGQRIIFRQPGSYDKTGVVIDMCRCIQWGALQWSFLVKYDGVKIPRWTNPRWMAAAQELEVVEDNTVMIFKRGDRVTVNGLPGVIDVIYKKEDDTKKRSPYNYHITFTPDTVPGDKG